MVRSRWTAHPTVRPECPVCLRPLPPVVVDVDGVADGGQAQSLSLSLQVLDPPWWDAAELEHPGCGIPTARQRYLAELS